MNPATPDTVDRAAVLASRILVVDPSSFQRGVISDCLGPAGYGNVVYAADGCEALRQFANFRPDLILLDIAMQGPNGADMCRAFMSLDLGSVPILVHSAVHEPNERLRAFQAGAVDFIATPLFPPELLARVQIHLDRRWMTQHLRQFQVRLNNELGAARLMQETLLPHEADLSAVRTTMRLDIAAHCEMSSELGGDFWGIRVIGDTRLGMFIADFTGHGVASAMNAFRLHALLGESGMRYERPELVMQALNVRLAAVLPRGTFATMFYGVLDTCRNRLDYAAAGAPPPVLIGSNGTTTGIDTSGVPLGIKHWQTYDVRSLDFAPGATLFFYSDALTETYDESGDVWDPEILHSVLGRIAPIQSAASGIDAVGKAFDARRPRPLPDDLTLVLVRRLNDIESH